MAQAPSPKTAQPPDQELVALRLTLDLRLSPEQFERVYQSNLDVVLELAGVDQLNEMTPTGGVTSCRNTNITSDPGTRGLQALRHKIAHSTLVTPAHPPSCEKPLPAVFSASGARTQRN